jgi:hypothetical protein
MRNILIKPLKGKRPLFACRGAKVTVCFSIKKPNFIITASDVLAEDPTTQTLFTNKKFFINSKRNMVMLLSGGWVLDDSDPDPECS